MKEQQSNYGILVDPGERLGLRGAWAQPSWRQPVRSSEGRCPQAHVDWGAPEAAAQGRSSWPPGPQEGAAGWPAAHPTASPLGIWRPSPRGVPLTDRSSLYAPSPGLESWELSALPWLSRVLSGIVLGGV